MDVCDKLSRYDMTQCARAIVGDQAIFRQVCADIV